MKIESIRSCVGGNPWKNWVFVLVRTDDGLEGVGEATLGALTRTVQQGVAELAPLVVGMDPFDVEDIILRLTPDIYADGAQIHGAIVAGVEMACWDLMGKAVGQPVHRLMGGRVRNEVPVYANGWYRSERTPEAFAEQARRMVDKGYRALKFDPFGSSWMLESSVDAARSLDLVAAVRDAVGPAVDLMIEGHSRFSVPHAKKVAAALQPYHPAWFEEPVAHRSIKATAEVARDSPVPIATGESFTSLEQFAELFDAGGIGIVQPEPVHLGGLWRARQVAGMAAAHYAVVAPHNAQSPVATAACLQLAACIPNFYVLETFEGNVDWEKAIVRPALEVQNGYLRVQDHPGLGVALDEDELRRHPYDAGNVISLFREGWERRVGSAEEATGET